MKIPACEPSRRGSPTQLEKRSTLWGRFKAQPTGASLVNGTIPANSAMRVRGFAGHESEPSSLCLYVHEIASGAGAGVRQEGWHAKWRGRGAMSGFH